jgi:hypothetical protein
MEEPPLIPVEVIEKGNNPVVTEPFISQPLPYMGPVLLLDVGIVVFMIRPASGKGNRVCSLREVS